MIQQKTSTKKEDIREFSESELYLRFENTPHLQQTWKSCINNISGIQLINTTCDEIFIYTEKQYQFLKTRYIKEFNYNLIF